MSLHGILTDSVFGSQLGEGGSWEFKRQARGILGARNWERCRREERGNWGESGSPKIACVNSQR